MSSLDQPDGTRNLDQEEGDNIKSQNRSKEYGERERKTC